jgi:hypothetical protein
MEKAEGDLTKPLAITNMNSLVGGIGEMVGLGQTGAVLIFLKDRIITHKTMGIG